VFSPVDGSRVKPTPVAEVAEHHRAHVDGRAEVLRDALAAAVDPRPVGVPGVEHRAHRHVELLARVLGELAAGALGDHALERLDQALQ